MQRTLHTLLTGLTTLLTLAGGTLQAEPLQPDTGFEDGSAWAFTFENDLFAGDDDVFTNGIAVQFGHARFDRFTDENLPRFLYRIVDGTYLNSEDDRSRGVVYTFAQVIQTPEDIAASEPLEGDTLYAGLLIALASLYAVDGNRADRLSLGAGVVGPLSLAEPSQTIIHRITGSEIPNGWDNQLGNEPVFFVEPGRLWRTHASSPRAMLEYDVIRTASIALGNLQTAARTSLIARIGKNLAASYALASVLPDRQVSPLAFSTRPSWYAFVGTEAAYIARDILIQGNTSGDNQSSALDHSQIRITVGAGWNRGPWAYTVLYSELDSTGDPDPFGSLSITRRYR